MDPIPIRELGKYGIIKDPAPFDLPINAFSDGSNVVFSSGRVTSAPICRVLSDVATVDLTNPVVYCASLESTSGYDSIILGTTDNKQYAFTNNTKVDITPAGAATAISAERYSHATLAGVFYLNRPDQVPMYYDVATSGLKNLPNWTSTWRAKVFRGFKDFAIAMNVTKGAIQYPQMFKWSNATLANSVPADWDPTVLSSLAGENTLSEATSQIIDGLSLRNDFIVYTANEVFVVEYTGGSNVFAFKRAFTDDGIMARDCMVEVNGKHFVMGRKDIYVHDGISKKSLLEGRGKSFVFNSLNTSLASKSFAFHYPKLNSIFFCFSSLASDTYYKSPTYCNKAVVYNYTGDTISYVDLPNVSSAAFANVASKKTWAQATDSWDVIGGQWSDQDDDLMRHVVLTSIKNVPSSLSASRLIGLDDATATKIGKPTSPEMQPQAYVSRDGITLQLLQIGLDSRTMLSTIYPLVQAQLGTGEQFKVSFGRSEVPDLAASPYNSAYFNAKTDYKVDSRDTGRFLNLRFDFPVTDAVYLSGYDVKLARISRR